MNQSSATHCKETKTNVNSNDNYYHLALLKESQLTKRNNEKQKLNLIQQDKNRQLELALSKLD